MVGNRESFLDKWMAMLYKTCSNSHERQEHEEGHATLKLNAPPRTANTSERPKLNGLCKLGIA